MISSKEPRWLRHTPPKKKRPPCDPFSHVAKGFTKKQLEAALNRHFAALKK